MTAALNRAGRRKTEKMARSGHQVSPKSGNIQMPLNEALKEAARQHEAGNWAVAESVYKAVLEAAPDQPDALQLLGILRHQQKETDEGLALIERACAVAPNNPEVISNFGAVLLDAGRSTEAETNLRRALQLDPGHHQARSNLIRLLNLNDRNNDAIIACREGIAAAPGSAIFHKILGDQMLKMRDCVKAMEAYRQVLDLDPNDASAMNDLAICCRELGDSEGAEHWYCKAVAQDPESATIRYNFGAFLLSLGRTDEAHEHLGRVLADNPDHWTALTVLAIKLIRMGREEEGFKTLHQIAESHPDDACVWNDVGVQFSQLGKFEEAAKMFSRAAELDPARVEPLNNLGNTYMKMYSAYDAILEYEKALKVQPRHLEIHLALCRALKEVHRYDEANLYARAAILLSNFTTKHCGNPLQTLCATCDYEGVAELGDLWDIFEVMPPSEMVTGLLVLLTYAENDETMARLSQLSRRWGKVTEEKAAAAPLPARDRTKTNPKIRIGFLSADLRRHSVSRFLMPLFHHRDRERFEFFCYSAIRVDHDEVQAEYRRISDMFTFIDNASDREVAAVIQADEIDILFELNGFTTGSRLPVVAWRPAPVQISWLGYPFTSTLKAMDYILVDQYLKPIGDGGLIEKPLTMSGSWVTFGEGAVFEPIEINPEPPMANSGVVTFGTLNNTYKYSPKVFALWAEVMKAVPNSRFLIVRPECGSLITCRNMAKAFADNGISTDRLYFINNRDKGSHLAFYNEIDISLDTFPLTGGTTTTESLWMGVPVITLVGGAMHQRLSYAILNHTGLDECCAHTPEEYVAKAAAFADVDKLRDMRRNMRTWLQGSSLARPDLFIKNFQATMEEVVRRHGLR
jgi:protein O-GlcNAc transferase